jgi:hypothetical protein
MYLISIILVESLAGVRLMGVCLEALRFFNLGWHGRDALKADLKDSDLSATANRTPYTRKPYDTHLVFCGLQPSAVARRVAAPCI